MKTNIVIVRNEDGIIGIMTDNPDVDITAYVIIENDDDSLDLPDVNKSRVFCIGGAENAPEYVKKVVTKWEK
jgi:hypothetical protein